MRAVVGLACIAAMATGHCGDIVFENARVRAVLGEDAIWRSLVDKASGAEHIGAQPGVAIASVAADGSRARDHVDVLGLQERITASAAGGAGAALARREGDRLVIALDRSRLVYRIGEESDWISFTLEGVSGTRPHRLNLLCVPVDLTAHVGTRLAGGWDTRFAVGLMALNLQAHATAAKSHGRALLTSETQDGPGPPLEGAAVALVAAPTADFRAILQRLAASHDLPRNEGDGRPSKALPLAGESYWFMSFGEADADRVIALCRQSGFRQVLLNSGAWCRSPGHYDFNTRNFPGGMESLRRTVAKLHGAGIGVGMHCFASKVAKADAHVAPVPDRRFWVDRADALAADIGPADTSIRVTGDLREWPGSPVASQKLWEGGVDKHREVIIDDEIIRYEGIGPEGRWDTFEGCARGAWGTRASAHGAGAAARHYGVDGCINGYIIDQETTLLGETTARLAGIFNACDFDMVYFDGGEDVDRRRFAHYVSKFQATAMGQFARRPIVHMGTILTHNLWHSFTRSGTVDTYLNTLHGKIRAGAAVGQWPTVRDHIEKSVAYVESLRDDMMPGELGWFGIWPKDKETEGLQIDEVEYLMCRSLAYDAPISLQTSFSQMDKHPLTGGILEVVRAYERARREKIFAEDALAPLREKGSDHALVRSGGAWRLVRVSARALLDGGVYAQTGTAEGGAVALLWRPDAEGDLRVPIPRQGLRFQDLDGRDVPTGDRDGDAMLPVGPRRLTLRAASETAESLGAALGRARFVARARR